MVVSSPLHLTSTQVHHLLKSSSASTLRVLNSDTWPVFGSLGDLLTLAYNEVSEQTWDQAFPFADLSWLPALITPEVPRTYSIASFSFDLLPESLDLTVARAMHEMSPLLLPPGAPKVMRPGVSSGFLNPDPTVNHSPRNPSSAGRHDDEERVCQLTFSWT